MPEAPKIFQVLTNLDIGGAQASVVAIACGLRRRGMNVHVVYSSQGGREPMRHSLLQDRLREAEVPTHDAGHMHRAVRPWADWAAVRSMRRLFERERPDVVHTHMSKAGILGRWSAHAAGVPRIVHTVRGWSFYSASNPLTRRAYVLMERGFAERTHALLVVSPRMIDDGLAAGIGTRDAYAVARTGIEVDRFADLRLDVATRVAVRERWNVPPDARVIGGVMHLTPQKAPLEFVDACARVLQRSTDVQVLLVGNGELRAQVDARIAEHGLSERFHLVGLQADVRPFLTAFDVLLLASHWEGLPRVALECVAAGIPIVATRVGGTAELETWTEPQGTPVVLHEAGDVEGLADAVADVLEAAPQSPTMRASASAETGSSSKTGVPSSRLPREFHLDAVLDVHEAIYCNLLERRG